MDFRVPSQNPTPSTPPPPVSSTPSTPAVTPSTAATPIQRVTAVFQSSFSLGPTDESVLQLNRLKAEFLSHLTTVEGQARTSSERNEIDTIRTRFQREFDQQFNWLSRLPNEHQFIFLIRFATPQQTRHIADIKTQAERALQWLNQFNIQSTGLTGYINFISQLQTLNQQFNTLINNTSEVVEYIKIIEGQLRGKEIGIDEIFFALSLKKFIDEGLSQTPSSADLTAMSTALAPLLRKAQNYLSIKNDLRGGQRPRRSVATSMMTSIADLEKIKTFEHKLNLIKALEAQGLVPLSPAQIDELTRELDSAKGRVESYINGRFFGEGERRQLTQWAAQASFSQEDIQKFFALRKKLSLMKELLKADDPPTTPAKTIINQLYDQSRPILGIIRAQRSTRAATGVNLAATRRAAQLGIQGLSSSSRQGIAPVQFDTSSANQVAVQSSRGAIFKIYKNQAAQEEESLFAHVLNMSNPGSIVAGSRINRGSVQRYGVQMDPTDVQRGYSIFSRDSALANAIQHIKTSRVLSLIDAEMLNLIDPQSIDSNQWEYNPSGTGFSALSPAELRNKVLLGQIDNNTLLRIGTTGVPVSFEDYMKKIDFSQGIYQSLRDDASWEIKGPQDTTWRGMSFRRLKNLIRAGQLDPQTVQVRLQGANVSAPLANYLSDPQSLVTQAFYGRADTSAIPEVYMVPNLDTPEYKEAYETCERYRWNVAGQRAPVDFKTLQTLYLSSGGRITGTAVPISGQALPGNIRILLNRALNVPWKLISPQIFRMTVTQEIKSVENQMNQTQWRVTSSMGRTIEQLSYQELKGRILQDANYWQTVTVVPVDRSKVAAQSEYLRYFGLGMLANWTMILKEVITRVTVGTPTVLSNVETKPFVQDMMLFKDLIQDNILLETIMRHKLNPNAQFRAVAVAWGQPLDMHIANIGLAPEPNEAYQYFRDKTFTVGTQTLSFNELLKKYLKRDGIDENTVVIMPPDRVGRPINQLFKDDLEVRNLRYSLKDALDVQWNFQFFDTDQSMSESNELQEQTGNRIEAGTNRILESLTGHLIPFRSALLEFMWNQDEFSAACIESIMDERADAEFTSWALRADAPIMSRLSFNAIETIRQRLAPIIESYSLSSTRRAAVPDADISVETLRNRFTDEFSNLLTGSSTTANRDHWKFLEKKLLWTETVIQLNEQTNSESALYRRYGRDTTPQEFGRQLRALNSAIQFNADPSTVLPVGTSLIVPQLYRADFPEISISNSNNTQALIMAEYNSHNDPDFWSIVTTLNPTVDFSTPLPLGIKIRVPLSSAGSAALQKRKEIASQLFPRITSAQLTAYQERKSRTREYIRNYNALKNCTGPSLETELEKYIMRSPNPLNSKQIETYRNMLRQAHHDPVKLLDLKTQILATNAPNYLNVTCTMYPFLADAYQLNLILYGNPVDAGTAIGHFSLTIENLIARGKASPNPLAGEVARTIESRMVVSRMGGAVPAFKRHHGNRVF